MKNGKPAVEDIIYLRDKTLEYYQDVHHEFAQDDTFHELDYLSLLGLPKELAADGVVLPTARMLIDMYTDHVDLSNANVFVNKKGATDEPNEEARLLRKFGLGILYRTNIESDVSPFRMAAKHQGMYGLGVLKDVWDADVWPDKPEQGNMSDSEYADLIDEFRHNRDSHLPIAIKCVHPGNMFPDYSYGGRQFVIETQEKVCLNVMEKYPKWGNPKGRKAGDNVVLTSFWTNQYRCELADDEPVIGVRGGVAKHSYGFIPYVLIESGLGNMSNDNDPAKRYVGILRHLRQMFISESRNYSLRDITCKKGALPFYTLEGDHADQVTILATKYGEANRLPPGVSLKLHQPAIASETILRELEVASSYIAAMAGPRTLQGVGESGVRSATHAQTLASLGSTRFKYPSEKFQYATAKVLSNCALIQKNVIPDSVRMWARTPTDEFDVVIDGKKFKEPITFYVEYAPTSEEDEYRKHNDIMMLKKEGLVTTKWARKQLPNVDVEAMELEEAEEQIMLNPNMMASVWELVMAEKRRKLGIPEPPPMMPQQPQGQPQGLPPAQQGQPRQVVAPPSPKPVPGSVEEMQNQRQNQHGPQSMAVAQGVGGGGNRR